jgi:hemerythrin superfamily protein
MKSHPISSGDDVVIFLKEQHQQVKELFARALTTTGNQRKNTFMELQRALALHEAAEEEVVHPFAASALPNGAAIVAARIREENEAKQALREMEALDVDSAEFATKLRTLQHDVLEHADREEREEFNPLVKIADQRKLEQMIDAVRAAEATAVAKLNAAP